MSIWRIVHELGFSSKRLSGSSSNSIERPLRIGLYTSAPGSMGAAAEVDVARVVSRNRARVRTWPGRVSVITQIGTLHQRIWLMDIAANIIGSPDKQTFVHANAEETRVALRWWRWSRLDAWDSVDLVEFVRRAAVAGVMIPWPEAQAWVPPSEGAGWFRRVNISP